MVKNCFHRHPTCKLSRIHLLFFRQIEQRCGIGDGLDDEHIAIERNQRLPEHADIACLTVNRIDMGKDRIQLALVDGFDNCGGFLNGRCTEQCGGTLCGDAFSVCRNGTGTQFQHTDGIAHTAHGELCDQVECILVNGNLFRISNVTQTVDDDRGCDAAEIVPLTAGQNRRGDFMHLGGCRNVDDMFRRFLQRFQKRIECRRGQHMYLVDDEYTLFALGRRIGDILADITDVVNTVVGGGVHFDDIGDGTGQDSAAGITDTARIAVIGIFTVECSGKQLGTGGFTGTARAAEQVCMRGFSLSDLMAENGGDMFLTVYVVKGQGTPFAVKRLMHERFLRFCEKSKMQNKTIHPKLDVDSCASIQRLPRGRHPCNTPKLLLNAAWFPT